MSNNGFSLGNTGSRTDNKINTAIQNQRIVQDNNTIQDWLKNTSRSFFELAGGQKGSIYRYQISPQSNDEAIVPGDIVLFQQYYIDSNAERHAENKKCLFYNSHNKSITKIILLNERLYSDEELGVKSSKIIQVVTGKRLSYKDAFEHAASHNIEGYLILANTDIFFDGSVSNVMRSGLSTTRKMFCQLRFEYDGNTDLRNCRIFGPRPDSQDTWIWHSNMKTSKAQRKILDIPLGTQGCDNKLVYLFNLLGFICHNEPHLIKTYHYHKSQIRNYNNDSKRATLPYYAIFPCLDKTDIADTHHSFDIVRENDNLRKYVSEKMSDGKPFIIPRIAGVENNLAMMGVISIQNGKVEPQFVELINGILPTMKKHTGIQISNIQSMCNYSQRYMTAFHKCEKYFWWEPWGNVVRPIAQSFDFVTTNFQKPKFDAMALDIFHSISTNPWTLALRGKRVLIISPFADSFKEKVDIREKIYGIDLFPDCELSFIKPPQTQGANPSEEFDVELKRFVGELEKIKDTFDIALCSCGGYGNLVCSELFDMGKSAIYVGGVLQMYFGVYGARWLRERPDAMRLYMNKYWSRPKEAEKPSGFKGIEDSCYW
jgi:hypothetical protein